MVWKTRKTINKSIGQKEEFKFPAPARLLLIPFFQSFYVVFHFIWLVVQQRKCSSGKFSEDEVDQIELMIVKNHPVLLLGLSESLLLSYLFPPEYFINFSTYAIAHWSYGLWLLLNSQSHFLQ